MRQCPRCEGSGQCSECRGQGFVDCVACQGSGQRTSSRGGSYACKNCSGTGRRECQKQCASCEGSGQITSELQQRVHDKYRVSFDNLSPLGRATGWLVMLCLAVYLIGLASPKVGVWLTVHLSNQWGLWSQPWRWLSSIFLHSGFLHVITNCMSLSYFGPWLEGYYGTKRFMLLFLFSGFLGSLASCLVHPLLGEVGLSVGASGALCGLSGAVCGGYLRYRVFTHQKAIQVCTWFVTYTVIALMWLNNIDHWAHLGGFLGGLAYAHFTRRPSGR